MSTQELLNDDNNDDLEEANSNEARDDADGIDPGEAAVDYLLEENEDGVQEDGADDENDDGNDLCELIYNASSNDSTVPVGITIAYKRYIAADEIANEMMLPSSTEDRTNTSATHGRTTGRRRKQQQPQNLAKSKRHGSNSDATNYPTLGGKDKKKKRSLHQSLQVLLESSAIYMFCIVIPPFIAYIYHNIIQEITWDTIKSLLLLLPLSQKDETNSNMSESSSTSVIGNVQSTSVWSWSSYSYYFPLDPIVEYITEHESYQYVKSRLYEPSVAYMCTTNTNYDAVSTNSENTGSYYYYASYLWSSIVEQTGICPPEYLLQQRRRRSIISDDMSMYMDVCYIMMCSFLLAIVRMMIVHYTIFKSRVDDTSTSDTSVINHTNSSSALSNVDTLTILVRCKSNHLLSSDYYNVPATPEHSSHQRRRTSIQELSSNEISQITVPDLVDNKLLVTSDNLDNNEVYGYQIDVSDRDHGHCDEADDNHSENPPVVRMNPLAIGITSTSTRSNRNDNLQAYQSDGDKDFNFETPNRVASTDNDLRNILSSTTMRWDNTISSAQYSHPEMDEEKTKQRQQREKRRLTIAAPRYATAIFRLLYCTMTAGIALFYFRHADFWPWFVFGTGRGTKQCWDLSGGLTVGGMDSDFDQHNAVLKRYFLWQASYHIHSTTFHFLISMLFIFNPFVAATTAVKNTGNDPVPTTSSTTSSLSPSKRLRGIKRGSNAYVRSFIQHLLSVVLIAVAYIFSSLRRLGAIGLFAFDVSSWSLHLLQICINAPHNSYLWSVLPQRYRKEKGAFIRIVYLYFVIPSFVIARFMIWPALWYSAAYESQSWLQQLEMTLWPGSALLLRCIMHTLMIILHSISLLYLHRLLSSNRLLQ